MRGMGMHPLPWKWNVSLNRPFAPKMPCKGLKWPRMPYLRILISCPANIPNATAASARIILKLITFTNSHVIPNKSNYLSRELLFPLQVCPSLKPCAKSNGFQNAWMYITRTLSFVSRVIGIPVINIFSLQHKLTTIRDFMKKCL